MRSVPIAQADPPVQTFTSCGYRSPQPRFVPVCYNGRVSKKSGSRHHSFGRSFGLFDYPFSSWQFAAPGPCRLRITFSIQDRGDLGA